MLHLKRFGVGLAIVGGLVTMCAGLAYLFTPIGFMLFCLCCLILLAIYCVGGIFY